MTENPARFLMILSLHSRRSSAMVLCCAALVSGGCAMKKRPNISWATALEVKPIVPAPAANSSNATDNLGPELRVDFPPFPGHLVAVRTSPPRPRVSTPPSTNSAGNDTEKPDALTIAPQLTPQELAVAQQQTTQSLSLAEKNLASARGKTLNATQADLASKIRGFIKDARQASQIGDWRSARSLAKKAQVLSEELAGSL